MFDLGLGSLHALSFEELVYLLLAMAAWIAAILVLGFDAIVAAIVLKNLSAILVELARRAWVKARSRRGT